MVCDETYADDYVFSYSVDLKSSVKVLERKLENKDDEIKACRKKFVRSFWFFFSINSFM